MSTRTRFEKEAKGNSEMVYSMSKSLGAGQTVFYSIKFGLLFRCRQ